MAAKDKTAKKGNRYFVWIILILLFVGLLGFGTGGLSGSIRSIGSVGEKTIAVNTYQRALNEQVRAFEAQVGTPVSFVQAQSIGLDQRALAQVVSTRTLDNEAASLGISVGDTRVRDEVLRIPAFRGLAGAFDREAYRFSLQQNGMTESEFESGIREEIARTLLQGAVVGGVEAPAPYADTIIGFIGERRDIAIARLSSEYLIEPVPGPTPSDITSYYEANPDQFTALEVRNITYAWLSPDQIIGEVTVDAMAVRALYDERIAEFIRPEHRLVERLVFSDTASAEAAKARLDAGELDFDALVSERGLDLADVDMGDVDQSQLGAAGEPVFAATAGDVIGPIDSNLGPALFRMNAVLAAEEIPFEDAEPDLREELAADRARRIIEDSTSNISDLLAGGATVTDLAERTDLTLGTIAWAADTQEGIAAYEDFRNAAADAEVGAFLEVKELTDGGIFVLQLDSITPPALRPESEVTDQISQAWTAQRTQEMLLEQAVAAASEIRPLTDMQSLGLPATKEVGLTRRSFVGGTPQDFITAVFDLEPGIVTVVENEGSGVIIVRLDRVTAADPDDDQSRADRTAILDNASAGIAQDIFEVFATEVQQRTDVSLNQQAINAVNATFQ